MYHNLLLLVAGLAICHIFCLKDIDTHSARELKHLDGATMSRLQTSAFVKLKSSFQNLVFLSLLAAPQPGYKGYKGDGWNQRYK
jgi:hypothetical protein